MNPKMPLVALLFIILCIPVAYAMPPIPHVIYGNITIDGAPAPQGTLVEALDSSMTVIASFTVNNTGLYGFLEIPGDDASTVQDEGANPQETIRIFVNGEDSSVSFPFSSGTVSPYTISVGSQQQVCSISVVIFTDRPSYTLGSQAMVFGQADSESCSQHPQSVQFSLSAGQKSLRTDTVQIDSEGVFEHSFELVAQSYGPGTYTVTALSGGVQNSTQFTVEPSEQQPPQQQNTTVQQAQPEQAVAGSNSGGGGASASNSQPANTSLAAAEKSEAANITLPVVAESPVAGKQNQTEQPANEAVKQEQTKAQKESSQFPITGIIQKMPKLNLSSDLLFFFSAGLLILLIVLASYLRVR